MAPTPGPSNKPQETKCPACGTESLPGADRCEQCLHSLMNVALPGPRKGESMKRALMTAPLSDLLTGKDLLVADPDDSILKVIRIFQKDKKDCILVFKKKKLVGILSQRDIILRVLGKHKDLTKVTIGAVMTPNPEFVKGEDPIAFVVNKMAMGGFRHVPVLAADGQPLSIATIRDVLKRLSIPQETKRRDQP